MRVLITGAGGFIGRVLTDELCDVGSLVIRSGGVAPITELVLADRVASEPPKHAPFKTTSVQADLSDRQSLQALFRSPFESIFHLAASLTLDAERRPDEAYGINVESVRQLIAMGAATVPRMIVSSSIAVFGGDLPDTVDERVLPCPATTYGSHKAIVELLIADASRQGRIDGRALRLPIVVIRPGSPTKAVSDQIASIVRDPLAGRDVICHLETRTEIPIASARTVARALIRIHDAPASLLPSSRAVNLPALTVRISDLVEISERRRAEDKKIGNISIQPVAALQRVVDGWPKRFVSMFAESLNVRPDVDLETIVRAYAAEQAKRN